MTTTTTTAKRTGRTKHDPVAELVSKDEDQLAEMFGELSDTFNGAIRNHIKSLRDFRDAGFAARADATNMEHIFDRAVSAFEMLLNATGGFINALDTNKPLPVPALRAAYSDAEDNLTQLRASFDEFMETRPSLRARKEREAQALAGVASALEPVEE